jgi:hypothetical protein
MGAFQIAAQKKLLYSFIVCLAPHKASESQRSCHPLLGERPLENPIVWAAIGRGDRKCSKKDCGFFIV